jgi:hypothetical protein
MNEQEKIWMSIDEIKAYLSWSRDQEDKLLTVFFKNLYKKIDDEDA